MANSVRIQVGVKDDASTPLDRVRDKFDDLRKQGAQGIIAGATAAATVMAFNAIGNAVQGVTSFMAEGVKGAIEEEASINRLTKAIEASDPAWDGNLDAIEKTIEARQSLGFSDDAQRDSLARLVASTHDHKAALDLQRVAMDLARFKGISLEDASNALIKVNAGQVRILKELGIELPKNATATERLAAIQRVAAGQAEAYGDTTAGSMEAAGIAIDNLKEEFGAVLLPIIKEGAQFLTETAIPAFKQFAGTVSEAAGTIGDAAADIDEFFKPVSDVINGIADLGPQFHDAIFGASADLGSVADAALEAYPSIETLFEALKKGVDQTANGEAAGDSFGRAFGSSWGKLADEAEAKARELPGKIADGIESAREAPVTAFDEMLEAMKNSMSVTAETAFLIGQLTDKRLAAGLEDADPLVRRRAEIARDSILDRLEELEPRAGTLTDKAWTGVAKMIHSKIPQVRAAGIAIGESIEEGVPTESDGRKWGSRLGAAYAAGLEGTQNVARAAAIGMSAGIREVLEAHSPPKAGPLKDIEKWAEATGLAWVDKFVEAIGTAEELTKLKLGGVQKAFQEFLKDYTGVGNLMASASPKEQMEDLDRYIANLTKALETETDPEKRLAIYTKLQEYLERKEKLSSETARPEETLIDTMQGYIENLDRALLTETDPEKRAALLRRIVGYIARIENLRAKMEAEDDAMESEASGTRALAMDDTGGDRLPVVLTGTESGDSRGPVVQVNMAGANIFEPYGDFARRLAEALAPALQVIWQRQGYGPLGS